MKYIQEQTKMTNNNKDERQVFKLSDEVMFQIAKLIQMCMLTGTHVVDNFRQMRLEIDEQDNGTLVLTPEYNAYFDNSIRKMMEAAEQFKAEVSETTTEDEKN